MALGSMVRESAGHHGQGLDVEATCCIVIQQEAFKPVAVLLRPREW